MSKIVDIWREKVPVRFGGVDRSDRLTLWGIFDFIQEAAISHAENLGVGRQALERDKQAWILSRLSLSVERRPVCGETVEVSTWPRGCEKLFALRDYTLRDEAGDLVVRGRGGWLVLDIEKRRPMRVQPLIDNLPPNDGIDAFPQSEGMTIPAGLNPREDLKKSTERSACYSDIDYYGHVNNARYIQWIQDAADMEILTAASQFRLDINYLSEVMPGATVEIWTANAEPCFAFEGRRPGSGQAVFRAELRTGFNN
jgi:acyl-ACP thioesterase